MNTTFYIYGNIKLKEVIILNSFKQQQQNKKQNKTKQKTNKQTKTKNQQQKKTTKKKQQQTKKKQKKKKQQHYFRLVFFGSARQLGRGFHTRPTPTDKALGIISIRLETDNELNNKTKLLDFSKLCLVQLTSLSVVKYISKSLVCLFVLRFYGPVNPKGSCRARSVYLATHLLGKLSPLSG